MDDEKKYLVYSTDYSLTVEGEESGRSSFAAGEEPVPEALPDDKKKQYLRTFFRNNSFRHVALLTGAGSSVMCGGKVRGGLWDACKDTIEQIGKHFPDRFKQCSESKDIESFLSYAVQFDAITNKEGLSELIVKLKSEIRQACTLQLDGCAHEEMLKKMTARKATLPRAEIFTTNYDTLFEQAARNAGIILIDGFSFSQPRTFSGRFFDLDIVDRERTRVKAEENYVSNVVHLHKLHGSLDWAKHGEEIVQCEVAAAEDPLIIYPSDDKYAESYDQPYFEMMARFQSVLREKDCLLMVVGYGFADKHINSAIIEAVRQNPSFHLLVVDYGIEVEGKKDLAIDLSSYKKLFGDIRSNVTLVQGSFAGFAGNIPLNKAYRVEEPTDMFNTRGGVM